MSRLIPQTREARVAALTILLFVAAMLGFVFVRTAQAAPYVNPFWTNGSPSQESAIPEVAKLAMSPEGVDVRTGELFWDHFLFRTPGLLEDNVLAIRWRSMISGSSQLGRQVLPSWETTPNKVILNLSNPNGVNGHRVDVRRLDAFMWINSMPCALRTVHGARSVSRLPWLEVMR